MPETPNWQSIAMNQIMTKLDEIKELATQACAIANETKNTLAAHTERLKSYGRDITGHDEDLRKIQGTVERWKGVVAVLLFLISTGLTVVALMK